MYERVSENDRLNSEKPIWEKDGWKLEGGMIYLVISTPAKITLHDPINQSDHPPCTGLPVVLIFRFACLCAE